ncbi:MAG TPA: DUF488 domain-containing protein [Pseudolabrys sp.]|nr:DUF488 domain-containing protein [Pseudolabrys sp.]
MDLPFFTIGHSTHPIGEFIGLLAESDVGFVVDVRTVPRSRTNPQFNADVLGETLAGRQIGYEHLAALGGLRPRSRDIAPKVNGFWQNQSFHNYADYAMTDGFRSGLARLRELGSKRRSVVMCAEAVWWRCHRRIIADYLLAGGEQVFHIMAPGKVSPATMTPAARPRTNGTLTYPLQVNGEN